MYNALVLYSFVCIDKDSLHPPLSPNNKSSNFYFWLLFETFPGFSLLQGGSWSWPKWISCNDNVCAWASGRWQTTLEMFASLDITHYWWYYHSCGHPPHHRTIDDSQLSSNCQISICFRVFLIVLNNQLIRWVKMIFFLLSSFDLFWSLFMTLPSWFPLFWRLMVLINIYSPPSPLHLSSRRHRNDKLIAATSRCWPEPACCLSCLTVLSLPSQEAVEKLVKFIQTMWTKFKLPL